MNEAMTVTVVRHLVASASQRHLDCRESYAARMPEQLDDAQWDALLLERDTFKLAIRGFAAIEADLNAFIEEAFESPLPGGVRGLGGFDKRLAVSAALGLVPTDHVGALRALAQVRHDFAHGNIDEVDDARAARLRDAYGDVLPRPARLDVAPARYTLVAALAVSRIIIRMRVDVMRVRRAELEQRVEGDLLRRAIIARLRELRGEPGSS
jgi:hypothetical protein